MSAFIKQAGSWFSIVVSKYNSDDVVVVGTMAVVRMMAVVGLMVVVRLMAVVQLMAVVGLVKKTIMVMILSAAVNVY